MDKDKDKDKIVFLSGASLWEMMAEVGTDGRPAKPFDMRRWDMADDRIYRLSWGRVHEYPNPIRVLRNGAGSFGKAWVPEEKEVGFVNKADGRLLTYEYRGLEFTDWAPGWGFLILGKRPFPPVAEE